MGVVSPGQGEPQRFAPPAASREGVPVAFHGNSGFFHPAAGDVGIILCSPWGFEELTLRKSWRLLAEAIAAAGHPCLRFDYPGTGDSLGGAGDVAGIETWVDSIHQAAACLRLKSGVKRFVFLGQSLGAALAVTAARARTDVVGLQLVAPVVKGRAYVRELAATAALVSQRIGVAHEASEAEALSVVGFPLSQSMVDSLKRLDLTNIANLGPLRATIFDQPGRKAAADLSGILRRAGARVAVEPVAPYHLLISDATVIQPLPADPSRIVAALGAPRPTPPMAVASFRPAILSTPDFCEEAVRFGEEGALFGILCRPARATRSGAPAIILLNRGLNPHTGWRRVSVEHARALARAGVVTLRIDNAGLGESRDDPERPANLIYSDLLLPDIAAAVDILALRGAKRVGLAGVCSGAYMALLAARHDARVTDVFAVNPQRLVWNAAERPEDVIRYGLRSMNDYVGDIRNGGALRKLMRSRRRILPALRYLLKRGAKQAMGRVPLALRSALLPHSMAAQVDAAFRLLAGRGTRIRLLFTPGDPGLTELRHYFGPDGRDLRHPDVSCAVIPGADHNLTATAASDAMLAELLAFAETELPREAPPPRPPQPAAHKQRAACPT